jgi:ribosomal protein S18 acetylase RimI-like enzyme
MPADKAAWEACAAQPESLSERFRRVRAQRGWQAVVVAILERIASPIVRLRRRLVFAASLDRPFAPDDWAPGEYLVIASKEDVPGLPPALSQALQTEDQRDDLETLGGANRVFILADSQGYLHRGYVRLTSPGAHDRKAVFFGDLEQLPEIRSCETAPRARGRGLYRRMITEEFRYLQSLGHRRATMYIMAENQASIRGATAAGYEICRKLDDWILFGRFVCQRVREGNSARWRFFVQ